MNGGIGRGGVRSTAGGRRRRWWAVVPVGALVAGGLVVTQSAPVAATAAFPAGIPERLYMTPAGVSLPNGIAEFVGVKIGTLQFDGSIDPISQDVRSISVQTPNGPLGCNPTDQPGGGNDYDIDVNVLDIAVGDPLEVDVSFQPGSLLVNEGGSATATLVISPAEHPAFDVRFSTTELVGEATGGADYAEVNAQTITIPENATSVDLVTTGTVDDVVANEGNEAFEFVLTTPTDPPPGPFVRPFGWVVNAAQPIDERDHRRQRRWWRRPSRCRSTTSRSPRGTRGRRP